MAYQSIFVTKGSFFSEIKIKNLDGIVAGEESPEAGSDEEVIDPRSIDADKERKRAGLPPLELDSLPSASANKMMTLSLWC